MTHEHVQTGSQNNAKGWNEEALRNLANSGTGLRNPSLADVKPIFLSLIISRSQTSCIWPLSLKVVTR